VKRKILAIVLNVCLAVLTLFSFVGCGEERQYNAVLIKSGIVFLEDFLNENVTKGVNVKDGGTMDEENLPKEYVYKVLDKSRADEIFSKIPAIDFEREMLILHGFTTTSHSDYKLTEVVFNEQSLVIKYGSKKEKGNQPPNASAPRTEWVVIKMDKLTADEVTVRYVGKVFG